MPDTRTYRRPSVLASLRYALPLALLLAPGAAFSQSAPAASCLVAPARLSDEALAAFKEEPAALLDRHPTGGARLAGVTRNLAGSDISTVDALIALARDGNPAQRTAIGAGLAQAANACVRDHPELAEQIQLKVAEAGIAEMTTAFLAVTNAVLTAGLPGGPLGAGLGAGAGGPIGAGPAGGVGGQGRGVGSGGGNNNSVGNPGGGFNVGGGGGTSIARERLEARDVSPAGRGLR